MLRHYHEIGLLAPDHVDEVTGYRFYNGDQRETLRQIVTLKDLGLSLADIGQVVHKELTVGQVRQLLLNRRAEAAEEVRQTQAIVERIDAQLETLSSEVEPRTHPNTNGVTMIEVEVKSVEARTVAQLSAVAESWAPTDIGPVIQPLYPELIARMEQAGVDITGPSTAWYEDTAEGRVRVHATLTVDEPPAADSATNPDGLDFEVVELPAIAQVASTIHRGTMDNGDTTYQALLDWIEQHGYQPIGYGREIDIECGPDTQWIVEIQIAIEPAKETP